ncbi:hypothetical protein ACQ5SO_16870 [Rhodovulum sp. DZ06]|uniref:hypothetical protein n=1 Tax=Rhodovulum sp. DZ06 TaxID=3425126 RepID=UPI003D325738
MTAAGGGDPPAAAPTPGDARRETRARPGAALRGSTKREDDDMQIDRHVGHAPRSEAAGRMLAALDTPCLGCKDCQGFCAALMQMLSLPDAVLNRPGKG